MRTSSMATRTGWLAATAAVIVWTALATPSQAQSNDKHDRAPAVAPNLAVADALDPELPPHPMLTEPWWTTVDESAWVLQPPADDGAPPAPSTRALNCCGVGGWVQSLGFNPVWTGNVFTISQPRILKEIKIEANFNGALDITFGIYREHPNGVSGDYTALCIRKVGQAGHGRDFYSSGLLNGGSGILLTPKETGGVPVPTFFAVAVGWGAASIDFRIDNVSYSSGVPFCAGRTRGSWIRTGTNPPSPACPSTHELFGLQFFPTGAISFELCFEEPGGACCNGDTTCDDDLTEAACLEQGGEFLGLYTICALDGDQCTGFGVCCEVGSETCALATPADCTTIGIYKGDGSDCESPANPCETVIGACCSYNGDCNDETLNEYDCVYSPLNDTPGYYQGDTAECLLPNGTNRCKPLGACCSLTNGSCTDKPESECTLYNCVNALSTNGSVICPAGFVEENTNGTIEDNQCPQAGTQCFKVIATYSLGQPCAAEACQGEVGACCVLGECQITNALRCAELQGSYTAAGTNGWDACNWVYPGGCPAPTEGACCLPNGNCVIREEAQCLSTNGVYQGDGIACSNFLCTPGACCHEGPGGQPACIQTEPLDCAQNHLNGEYRGAGSTCPSDPSDCFPSGACCFESGACSVLTANGCSQAGGTYEGNGVTCEDAACPQPGACCFGDASCRQLTETQCITSNGTYNGIDTLCGGVVCELTAACCYTLFGPQCQVLSEADCNTLPARTWGTPGSMCTSNGCQVGACCDLQGICTSGLRASCDATETGLFLGSGSTCSPNQCVPRGACCVPGLDRYGCNLTEADDCNTNGMVFQGVGISCGNDACATVPCCITGQGCDDLLPEECATLGGIAGPDGAVCSDADFCGTGACCVQIGPTPTCFPNIQWADCLLNGGAFKGVGTTCTTGICNQPFGACCLPNTSCEDVTQATCTSLGGTLQVDTYCSAVNCGGGDGACCQPDNSCADMNQVLCDGITDAVFLPGQNCGSASCPEFAYACCDLDQGCTNRTPSACASLVNTTFHNGQFCASFTCPDVCGSAVNSDYDGDGHVDLLDFAKFQRCMGLGTAECLCPFDANTNGVIDPEDAESFVPVLTGPQASAPLCAPYQGYAAGDFANDGDVTLHDFAELQWCSAPGGTLQCRCIFDSNANIQVDLADYVAWLPLFDP